jgi:hypothetical protein
MATPLRQRVDTGRILVVMTWATNAVQRSATKPHLSKRFHQC